VEFIWYAFQSTFISPVFREADVVNFAFRDYEFDPESSSIFQSKLGQDQGNSNIIDEARQESQENQIEEQSAVFDVAIIGAGFSGLSAALLLGRYLRPTVIFDGGNTRNSTSKHVHGYLGFENSSPQEFMQKAWSDVLQYNSIKVVREKVIRIERNTSNSNYFFLLTTESGEVVTTAKYLIIATGIEDSKPNIENFDMFDGIGAWHCPHCDGFQTTNRKLAILTYGKNIISYAKEFLGWTRDITVIIQGNYKLTDKDKNEAKTLGIRIFENNQIIKISGARNGHIEKIICQDGRSYEVDVIFYYLGYTVQNQLAKQLGCELDEEEGFVKVNSSQQTTVRNVYAVGDLDTDRHYVVFAAASGAVAAISIYEQLLKDAIRNTKE
jgi:thioredoxin reductase